MKKLLLTILLCSGLSACGNENPFPSQRQDYTLSYESTDDTDILTISFAYITPTTADIDSPDDTNFASFGRLVQIRAAYVVRKMDWKQVLKDDGTCNYSADPEKRRLEICGLPPSHDYTPYDILSEDDLDVTCESITRDNNPNDGRNKNKAECVIEFPKNTFSTIGVSETKKYIKIFAMQHYENAGIDNASDGEQKVATPRLMLTNPNAEIEDDHDGDGIVDDEDNCPDIANDDQLDTDNDDVGDACEDIPNDRDNDHIVDGEDNCPELANGDQLDTDNDGTGDACEERPTDCVNKATIGGEHVENKVGACGDVDKDIMHKGKARLSDGGSCSLNPKTPHQNWELFFLLGGTLYLASKRRKA